MFSEIVDMGRDVDVLVFSEDGPEGPAGEEEDDAWLRVSSSSSSIQAKGAYRAESCVKR